MTLGSSTLSASSSRLGRCSTRRDEDGIGHLRVSPRGDWLAFIDHHPISDDGGSVVAVDRSGAKRTLSQGWTDLYGVAWRPDGREVWFTASKEGARDFKALYAVTLDGKERAGGAHARRHRPGGHRTRRARASVAPQLATRGRSPAPGRLRRARAHLAGGVESGRHFGRRGSCAVRRAWGREGRAWQSHICGRPTALRPSAWETARPWRSRPTGSGPWLYEVHRGSSCSFRRASGRRRCCPARG